MKIVGVVKEVREFKWGGFIILETDGLLCQCVYKDSTFKFQSETQVELHGQFVDATVKKELVLSNTEFVIENYKQLTTAAEKLPFNIYEKDIKAEIFTILENRTISLRNEKFKSIFKIQSTIKNAFIKYFEDMEFYNISTPKLTKEGAEGGTNIFKLDYFGQDAFLAQSPQLYKQMMIGSLRNVYEVAPVFRAEEHDSSRHLNEYISMDVEMTLTEDGIDKLISTEMGLIEYILKELNLRNRKDLEYLNVELPKANHVILTFDEVQKLLGTNNTDMNGEDEIKISAYVKEHFDADFLFITNYPKMTRPFYTKEMNSFDLIFKGIEITSGSQRRENYEDLTAEMKNRGLNIDKFKYYLDGFRYGVAKHGGFAIGLERLTAKICNIDSTKLCSLFPRDVKRLVP